MARTPQKLKDEIVGVVAGLPTLFNPDYSINHEGMRTHVDFFVENDIDVLMLSREISEFHYLTYEEIKAATKNVAEAVGGRVPFVASVFEWWTGQAVEFVKYVQDVGADGCLVMPPYLYRPYDPAVHDDAFYKHFETVAEATDIGLLIHERNVLSRLGPGKPLSTSLVDRLASIDSVVGMKMEGGDLLYAQQVVRKTKDRLAIIGDWGDEAWFFTHEYGVPSCITGIGQFAPRASVEFWNALRDGRLEEARKMVNDVLTPYYLPVAEMDWVAAIKVSMEFVGLPPSPMRAPNAQLTEAERESLRQAMLETGLLSNQ